MISLIVAMDKHRLIGKAGWMPWNLKEDLQHFKQVTLNHKIVMGRTTFEGLGKPLANRTTYVLTRNEKHYDFENVEVIHDLDALCRHYQQSDEQLIICGGAQIYERALPYVTEMWISLVEGDYEGDTYFPVYDPSDFESLECIEKNGFTIHHLKRK